MMLLIVSSAVCMCSIYICGVDEKHAGGGQRGVEVQVYTVNHDTLLLFPF